MLDFFSWIYDFFQKIWIFIENFVSSLFVLLEVIAEAIVLPPFLVGFVPAIIGASITAVTSIAVAKLILGR